jgi:hypothetical protein
MEEQMIHPKAFSLESATILAVAATLAEDDASGSVLEAYAGGASGPAVVSGAHVLSALDAAEAGAVPSIRASPPCRLTSLVQRILDNATAASLQASAEQITPDHLRAGLNAVLEVSGVSAEGLRRARERALGLAPSNLGVTALRHRDVSVSGAR